METSPGTCHLTTSQMLHWQKLPPEAHLPYLHVQYIYWRCLMVMCVCVSVCLSILFLKHNILLFCHEWWTQRRVFYSLVKKNSRIWRKILLDLYVDISHRRHKLRRDVEQTPYGTVNICSNIQYCMQPHVIIMSFTYLRKTLTIFVSQKMPQ